MWPRPPTPVVHCLRFGTVTSELTGTLLLGRSPPASTVLGLQNRTPRASQVVHRARALNTLGTHSKQFFRQNDSAASTEPSSKRVRPFRFGLKFGYLDARSVPVIEISRVDRSDELPGFQLVHSESSPRRIIVREDPNIIIQVPEIGRTQTFNRAKSSCKYSDFFYTYQFIIHSSLNWLYLVVINFQEFLFQ